MKYKALFLDVDGTIVPNRPNALPSARVASAMAKASKLMHVSIATGRPLFMVKNIIDHLHLSGPCIVTDGTQIYDPTTKKYIYESQMSVESFHQAYAILKKHHVKIHINDGDREDVYTGGKLPKKILVIFIPEISREEADSIVKELANVPGIIPYKGVSWTPGMEYVAACSPGGTKLNGIVEVAKMYGIQTHEMIGVGDGYNDFPLLLACGLKIAMGNAVPELKAIADFIAPSVDDDGVATVIEKFVLSE